MKFCFVGLENLPVLAPDYAGHTHGGEELQQTLLARALAERGFDTSMVVADYGQAEGAVWDQITTHKAHRLTGGLPVLRFIHPRWTGLWNALKRADAHTYYTSCAGMHVGEVAAFCRYAGKRMVFRVAHDFDCDPQRVQIRLLRDRKLYTWGLRHSNAILVQSERQREALLRNFGLTSTVAGMLVESPRTVLPHADRELDVLWVNNFAPIKRPELAVDLARSLGEARVDVVGGPQAGQDVLYESLRREALAWPNLHFHGRVPYREVGGLFASAKVFVNTSDAEGFPNSFLQSWVRGVPVVSFFDPDGLIRRKGLGVAATSFEHMRQAILRLLQEPDVWREASLRCMAFMAEHYRDDDILPPYLSALEGSREEMPVPA